MEIRTLKYFLMVAREKNITKAAQLLHVAQPSLSRQIMQLEDELGTKLFHRGKYRVTLTDDGLLLQRRAQEIIALADKTAREFARQDENLSGVLSIGSGEFHSSRFFFEAAAAFREKNPLVTFDIYSGNSDNIKERLEKGLLDLGLLLEPVDVSKYEYLRLPVKEEWGALVNESTELAGKDALSPQDLAHLPLIFTHREMVRNELTNWFGPYAEQLDIIGSGNLHYNMAVMAQCGMGTVLTLNPCCQYDGLKFIPLTPKLESVTLLVWKKATAFSPVTSAFLDHFKKYVENFH
ncbi:MAG: LysR family transcriptional regulator [Eubacteriales bacterium]|nr:LysR family transcriptional regulator [Eubacteriales bacterium]